MTRTRLRLTFAAILAGMLAVTVGVRCAVAGAVYHYALHGEITEETSAAFKRYVDSAKRDGASHLVIEISSPGGDATAAVDMYRALRMSGIPSTCTVRGMAASGAALFLGACSTRLVVKGSKIVYHRPYIGVRAPMGMPFFITPEMANDLATQLNSLSLVIDGLIAGRLGLSLEAYRAKVARGANWELTADEALAARAVDRVIE